MGKAADYSREAEGCAKLFGGWLSLVAGPWDNTKEEPGFTGGKRKSGAIGHGGCLLHTPLLGCSEVTWDIHSLVESDLSLRVTGPFVLGVATTSVEDKSRGGVVLFLLLSARGKR